jgi:hypothetical protein
MRFSDRLNWVVAVIGIWGGIAPFILGYSLHIAAVWDAIIVGLAFLVFGVWSALSENAASARGLNWINFLIGIWLIISPFVLGFSSIAVAMWNSIIVGAVVGVLELGAALSIRETETVNY